MALQKLSREQLTVGEYEKLACSSLFDYLTKENKPDEQYYLRDDTGFVVEVSVFNDKTKEELDRRLKNFVHASKKWKMMDTLGF